MVHGKEKLNSINGKSLSSIQLICAPRASGISWFELPALGLPTFPSTTFSISPKFFAEFRCITHAPHRMHSPGSGSWKRFEKRKPRMDTRDDIRAHNSQTEAGFFVMELGRDAAATLE